MITEQDRQWRYPGARWWKFDLHTHTPASADYGKGPNQASLRQITPRDWLLGYMRADVDCVAVTDHNSGKWIDKLKTTLDDMEREQHAEYRPLHLFPGVEITANGGTHVLAILDPTKKSADVTTLLGAVAFRGERGSSDMAADKAPIEVVEAIVAAGALPILAHVDGPSGAWNLTGSTLPALFDVDDLFAMEVVDVTHAHPDMYLKRKLAWAEVLGSDSHHPNGNPGSRFPGSHYTWVKMAQPSLEGLRLALLDGGAFSIRRSDEVMTQDLLALPKHFIEAIEVSDARYMGRGQTAKLEFNPWFNALIGGRGTGKSTVIHALRVVSGRERELDDLDAGSDPRVTFERFNRVPADRRSKGGLTDSTKIHWTVMRDGVRYRVTWRQGSGAPTVEEDAVGAGWKASQAQTVTATRFPLRMFGQGQIAALAGDRQQALLHVIDDAAGVAALRRKLVEAKNAFYALRGRIRELDGKLARRDDLVVEQEDVGRKLKRFEEAGHKEILTSYRQRNRQRREMDRQFGAARATPGRINELAAELVSDDLPGGLFVPGSAEAHEVASIVKGLADGVSAAARELRDTAQRLRDLVEAQREALEKSAWRTAAEQARVDYEALVETLRAEGVDDLDEYGRLVQERQRIDSEVKRLDSMKEERDRLRLQEEQQRGLVQSARRAVSDARDAFLEDALAKNNFVRIRSRAYGEDPRIIESSLRDILGVTDDRFRDDILVMEGDRSKKGVVSLLVRALPEGTEKRREEFEQRIELLKRRIDSATLGHDEFGGHFNNYFKREFTRKPELLDKLLTWFPEDALNVEYSRRGDGTDFRPIGQASAGQRAAAMLAFLLAHGEEPLVLDQPEDDLDNHLIYDLVVRQIKENKARRQIVVVTHNPNVVVNGDAEMLHALDFIRGQCVVAQSGSLQKESMRDEVCRVIEGGREAFARRYRRLGQELTHVRQPKGTTGQDTTG